jgi:hypothetical protein
MSFLSKVFEKSNNPSKSANNTINLSKDAGVPYNNDLISALTKDHKTLVEEFTKIVKVAQNKNFKTLKRYIKTFKVTFEIHNYSEKIQLYLYLKNYYKDSDDEEFIEDMTKSADKMYKDIFTFLKKYENIEFNNQYLGLFKKELETIGKILKPRIEVEESELYPLYKK